MTGTIESLLSSLGPIAVLAVMAIIFAETGLLLGLFLPGDSLLFTTGLLVARGVLGVPIWAAVVALAVAAFAGGQVGYHIGCRAGPYVLNRPRSRLLDPEHLQRASTFFDHHGPRAVILARFVPVARTLTPLAAGAGRMGYRRFTAYNLIGGVVWCASMLIAGYFLGRVSFFSNHIELIAIGIVLISLTPAGLTLLRRRFSGASGPRPWLIGVGSAACAVTVAGLAYGTAGGRPIASLDARIASAVVTHRESVLTSMAQTASWVGAEASIALAAAALLAWLLITGQRSRAVVLAAAMLGSAALTLGIKHAVMRPRPSPGPLLGPVDHTYSFPSGHTLSSATFSATVVWLLWPLLTRAGRSAAILVAAIIAASVGASRVYLGYHWPSDVVAAWLTATAWLGTVHLGLRAWDSHIHTGLHSHDPHTTDESNPMVISKRDNALDTDQRGGATTEPLPTADCTSPTSATTRTQDPPARRAGGSHDRQPRCSHEPGRNPLSAVPRSWQATPSRGAPDGLTSVILIGTDDHAGL